MQPPTNAIILDLGGVVLNIDYQRTQEAFRDLGFPDFDQLYTQFKQSELFVKLEKGHITPADFLSALRRYSSRAVTDQQLTEAWNAMLLDLPPEHLASVSQLKADYQLYLLSNTNAIHYERFFDKVEALLDQRTLRDYFRGSYYSHLVGERKPDQRIFELVSEANGLVPEQTLFIDDSPQHVEAARALGFRTHQKDQRASLPATLAYLGLA